MKQQVAQIKTHFKKNEDVYVGVAIGVTIAGLTHLIMRDTFSQSISRGISVTAQGGISVLGKRVVMNNVSYISSHRSGPPSWVVRCIETGQIYTSQKSAASEMGLPPSEISKHLNGLMKNVRGFTFERICLAA